nr:uncharacterized protein si:ch211-227n13.3 isoform X2 [Scatophagus argus]XP_046264559.1 uncharacterized protein si:ch211-227n13.3 isoform X2 [Scatophagus argus]XP_046264560.1 uncharacterized protein si:ch211-227n13.3 isoform X2 [Scatophagus argus]
MNCRRSSRLTKASEKSLQRSPSPNEVVQHRLRGKRKRRGLRKSKADYIVIDRDKRRDRDIIDIINNDQDAKHIAKKDEGKFVEVADEGVDMSDEDCNSVTSSVASGPSCLHSNSAQKHSLCSACQKLYHKAKKMKAPIKSKLLDSDPKSLTCDQWVLIKNWRPKRLPSARGKLLIHVHLVKKRLKVKDDARRTEKCVGGGQLSACSRPHTFLQRNLRRCVRVPVKKKRKNRRKRTRTDSQSPCVTKQQCLHSNNHQQHISIDRPDNDGLYSTSGHSSCPGFEGWSEKGMDDTEDTHLAAELISTTVTLQQTTQQREDPPKQKPPKKTRGFRDLLAQLRSNSSVIVKESR